MHGEISQSDIIKFGLKRDLKDQIYQIHEQENDKVMTYLKVMVYPAMQGEDLLLIRDFAEDTSLFHTEDSAMFKFGVTEVTWA